MYYSELKTTWVNPFNLCPAVTISNLKAGLGILYAQGMEVSSEQNPQRRLKASKQTHHVEARDKA